MITVITSNQPRHMALINRLSEVDDVRAIVEVPSSQVHVKRSAGMSELMTKYFSLMKQAESYFFPDFCINGSVEVIPIPMYTVNQIPLDYIPVDCDVLTFGCSWIKGDLFNHIKGRALNVHAGISPEFRGASANFWAMWNDRPDLVGVTVQHLSEELDCGQTLFSTFADTGYIYDPFRFTMSAIRKAIYALAIYYNSGLFLSGSISGERKPIRDCKKADFTDDIVESFLKKYKII